jgi:putative aminopeptidase FrvX
MEREAMLDLLAELVACQSPSDEEREVDRVVRREFQAIGVEMWQDDATNLYAHLPGNGPKVMICAHKDEIGMIVSKIETDGRLRVVGKPLGARPWKYGEGPIDLIADDGSIVRGILSVGSTHTTTGPVHELDTTRPLTWDMVTMFTGLSPAEIEAQGVHIGSRAVVARERKQIQRLGDYIATFALDDRAGVVILIRALQQMCAERKCATKPGTDLYFVATYGEESGTQGAVRAAQLLQPDICIAVDNAVIADGNTLVLDARPGIWYTEGSAFNNKAECDRLLRLAKELGFGAQPCLYTGPGLLGATDAGRVKQAGLAGKTVCISFVSDNSHGFEITHVDSMPNTARLLLAYLKSVEEQHG